MGFVSMTVDQAAQFYNNGHGKQLRAFRDVIVCKNPEGVEERMSIFLIDKDLGNVAYSFWIKSVLNQGTMYELLGQTSNKEFLGTWSRWSWDSLRQCRTSSTNCHCGRMHGRSRGV